MMLKKLLFSALTVLIFTSCEKYVLPQSALEYSLGVFDNTLSEYEESLNRLHNLEMLQENALPEEKDALSSQMDSVFLQMSYLIGMHESTRVAIEKLSGKPIAEVKPAPVVVPVYRYVEAMRVFKDADASMQKEERLLQQLKTLTPEGKNIAAVKKSERKLTSFKAYYLNFAYIMQSLKPEKVATRPKD